VTAARATATLVKIRAQCTDAISKRLVATLCASASRCYGYHSTLAVGVPGFGTLSLQTYGHLAGEFGAQIDYRVSDRIAINVFGNRVTGEDATGTRIHVGDDVKFIF